jgi:GAF domain-containing protein
VIGQLPRQQERICRFEEDHVQMMAAIAGISAVALDNARRTQWLEQENQRLMWK